MPPKSYDENPGAIPLSPEGVPEALPLYPSNGALVFGPEATFHALIDTLHLGVNYCDPHEQLLFVNNAFAKMMGYTKAEMIGRSSYELILPPEHQDYVRSHIADRMRGVAEHYEVQFQRKDGSRFWGFVSASPVKDSAGRVVGSVAIIQDITEQKKSLDAIKESERKYRNLVETVSDLIWAVDAEGRWTFVNRACVAIYGYEPDEMLGRPFSDFLSAQQAEKDYEVFKQILSGTPCFNYVTEHRRKDGSMVKLRFNAITLRNNDGDVIGTTGTATDITEHLRIEEEAQRLQKQLLKSQKMEAIGQLAAGIAHDLNNALGAVVGHLQLIKANQDLPTPLERSANVALSGCERASSLIDQLLGFSRQGKYNFKVLSLSKLVTETLQFVSRIIGKEIEIIHDESGGDFFVRVDEGQIQQAIVNLMINAKQAMPVGGRITLRYGNTHMYHPERFNVIAKEGTYVWLSITDTGEGIAPQLIDKVFEPFFTTKAEGKGSGLGLAMVYGIMQSHGGWVEVDSEPGKGATFALYFPRTVEKESEGTGSRPEQSSISQGCVLVVDDEPELVELAKIFLAQSGLTVHGETSVRAAIEWYKEHWQSVDMILLDIKMPEMGGSACFHAIRLINPKAQVALVTGYVQDHEATRLLESGALKFFQKPIRYPELTRWICDEIETAKSKKS